VDLPRRRYVPPLTLTREVVLFRSEEDVQEAVGTAQRRCRLGAVLAAGGFGLVIANAAASLPPAACALLFGGATANSYALAVVAQRLIRNTAARHVERLTVLPTPEPAADSGAKAARESAGAASLLYLAATVEERLAVTPEVCLEVRTANADRWLVLADLAEPDGEEEDLRGLHDEAAHRRAPFADICRRIGLLHINVDEGTCADQAFLSAMMSTQKVVVEERVEPRQDTAPLLATPPDAPVCGPMLSEVSLSDVEQAAKVVSAEAPVEAIERLGWRARAGGLSVLGAGALFMVGESAKDPDGVPRWKNLTLPI